MFYNIYQGGGGLGLLQPAGIHRRHQGGPAAAQLVERGKLGGVFAQITATRPRLQGAVWRFRSPTRRSLGIPNLKLHLRRWRKLNSLSVRKRSSTSLASSDFPPAGALLLFIFKNPPPSPHDQPWSTRTTDARRASGQSRERSSQARPRDSR